MPDTPHAHPIKIDTGKTLLLVEDVPDNLQLESIVLRAYGFRVDECRTGMEALSRLRDGSYDGLLLCLKLPDMDGLELARRVRNEAETSTLPIIIITGRVMPGDREKGLAAGCDAYIAKPVNTRTLALEVEEALQRPRRKPALHLTRRTRGAAARRARLGARAPGSR